MGLNFDPAVNNSIFRKDYPVILALNAHLATILPVRLDYNALGYPAGQVLCQEANGLFEKYSAGSGSALTAQCILLDTIPLEQFIAPTGTAMGRGVFGGQVYLSPLADYNATVLSNLNGRIIKDASGVQILSF